MLQSYIHSNSSQAISSHFQPYRYYSSAPYTYTIHRGTTTHHNSDGNSQPQFNATFFSPGSKNFGQTIVKKSCAIAYCIHHRSKKCFEWNCFDQSGVRMFSPCVLLLVQVANSYRLQRRLFPWILLFYGKKSSQQSRPVLRSWNCNRQTEANVCCYIT